jgi:phage gpG-like protein
MTITTNAAEVAAVLNGYVARMRDMRGVMDRIGTYAGNKALLAIMDEKDDPEGRPWTEWRESTREQRIKKGTEKTGLLWDDGTLLASIKVQAGLRTVTVGTDTPYAKFLQDGTSKMAARPLLGWSDEDIEYAERLIALHVQGVA